MVMGNCHATHGLTAGLAVSNLAPLAGLPMNIPTALVLGGLGAGAAIAPDLDHPGATATRSLGVLTATASTAIRALSAFTYQTTKTHHDRDNESGHRGITHTLPGALGLGALFGGTAALAGILSPTIGMWTSIAIIWLFLVWALRALPPVNSRLRDYLGAAALTAGAYCALEYGGYANEMPLFLGVTIALGAYVHSLGDALTLYGSPLLWPLKFRGERWYGAGTPRFMRFPAGKQVEARLVYPASLVLAGVALVGVFPGAWGWVLGNIGAAGSWCLSQV
jgi:membrane-bound metal-dependent hydrolase YbcI (DUF457 family)